MKSNRDDVDLCNILFFDFVSDDGDLHGDYHFDDDYRDHNAGYDAHDDHDDGAIDDNPLMLAAE